MWSISVSAWNSIQVVSSLIYKVLNLLVKVFYNLMRGYSLNKCTAYRNSQLTWFHFVFNNHWVIDTAGGTKVHEGINKPSSQTCPTPIISELTYHRYIYSNLQYYVLNIPYIARLIPCIAHGRTTPCLIWLPIFIGLVFCTSCM